MIEPILSITAITGIGLHLLNKPYTVTVAIGLYTPPARKKTFRSYDDAIIYAKTMNKDFKYVWLNYKDKIHRIDTKGKVHRIKRGI